MSSRIAICLFQDHIDNFNDHPLVGGNDLQKSKMNDQYAGQALFYYRSSPPATPDWVEIAKTFIALEGVDLTTSSSGGILLMRVKNRIMGCCFGSSVSNINRESIVDDFGLGVAYSRIIPRNTKSMESFTLSANPITNNRSAAIPTTRDNFNIDLNLENITELSGFIYRDSRHILIKGKEFYSTPSPLNLEEIFNLSGQLLDEYLAIQVDDDYVRLTSTKKVKSKNLIDSLNGDLVKKINRKVDDIFIVDFELQQNISGYRLTPKGQKMSSIGTSDFYDIIPARGASISYLKSKEIYPYNLDDQLISPWKLYKCIFCEIALMDYVYILYKGNWYSIDANYLDGLRNFIRQHEVDNLDEILSTKWDGKMSEGKYNTLAAQNSGNQCWDKIGYTHQNFEYSIEFCDILTPDFIIHMKKLKNSALNSHLLMQTAVSAQLLSTDPSVRTWISDVSKRKFRKNIILNKKKELKNPGIEYMIGLMSTSDESLADSLPFFSLISFNFVIKKIQQMGFNVHLGKV